MPAKPCCSSKATTGEPHHDEREPLRPRHRLARVGIAGEIVPTPGHSDDSVSLVLDSGEAFTGDLTHPQMAGEDELEMVKASWRGLRDLGAVTVYPGHGGVRSIFSALAE